MRLIDADKLFLHLNDWALAGSPTGFEDDELIKEREIICRTINDCMKAVEEQPTAYDVDKVVGELRACSFEVISEDCYVSLDLDEAIDIVKEGGSNEID